MLPERIYLVGMPGVGKTTSGIALSTHLGFEFLDLDKVIIDLAGKSISSIFKDDGEEAFRHLEKQALHQTQALNRVVISTGGGCACFFDNMQQMNQWGLTVWINLPIDYLVARVANKPHRPHFVGLDQNQVKAKLQQLFFKREKHYRLASLKVAHGAEVINAVMAHNILHDKPNH